MERNLEKLTKEQLITVIKEQDKRLAEKTEQYKLIGELKSQLELLNYLYDDYVPTMRQNQALNDTIKNLQDRLTDLTDLCDRQQKIIDSGCLR